MSHDAEHTKRAHVQLADNLGLEQPTNVFAQADLDLYCLLTESAAIVEYVNRQIMPRLDCTDAHGDLDHSVVRIRKGPFSALRSICEQ